MLLLKLDHPYLVKMECNTHSLGVLVMHPTRVRVATGSPPPKKAADITKGTPTAAAVLHMTRTQNKNEVMFD